MPYRPLPRQQPTGQDDQELLNILAHELRRPLTALLGALATLQHRQQTLSMLQQQELLGIARRQGEQLGRFLEQILTAASLDRRNTRLAHRSLVDGAVLATEAGAAARLAHRDHPITIEAVGPLLVRADPLAISGILGNLLDNAAAYSPHGAGIRLSASRDGRHAVLAVQDQGPGIPPADRDWIFQRYTRLNPPTASPGAGLGLGLYIARRLAHANQGELQVTNLLGRPGTRFELRLPLTSSMPHPSTTAPANRDPTKGSIVAVMAADHPRKQGDQQQAAEGRHHALNVAGGSSRQTLPCRAVAELIPEARFQVMDEEAHQPFQELPEEWNAVVDAFWRQLDAPD